MTLRKSSWKRLGLLALIVAVMFTFAACDSDNGDDETTSAPVISSFEDVSVEVEYGTSESDALAELPDEIEATLDNGDTKDVEVEWAADEDYESETPDDYTFKGTVDDEANEDDLIAEATVTVLEEETPEDDDLSGTLNRIYSGGEEVKIDDTRYDVAAMPGFQDYLDRMSSSDHAVIGSEVTVLLEDGEIVDLMEIVLEDKEYKERAMNDIIDTAPAIGRDWYGLTLKGPETGSASVVSSMSSQDVTGYDVNASMDELTIDGVDFTNANLDVTGNHVKFKNLRFDGNSLDVDGDGFKSEMLSGITGDVTVSGLDAEIDVDGDITGDVDIDEAGATVTADIIDGDVDDISAEDATLNVSTITGDLTIAGGGIDSTLNIANMVEGSVNLDESANIDGIEIGGALTIGTGTSDIIISSVDVEGILTINGDNAEITGSSFGELSSINGGEYATLENVSFATMYEDIGGGSVTELADTGTLSIDQEGWTFEEITWPVEDPDTFDIEVADDNIEIIDSAITNNLTIDNDGAYIEVDEIGNDLNVNAEVDEVVTSLINGDLNLGATAAADNFELSDATIEGSLIFAGFPTDNTIFNDIIFKTQIDFTALNVTSADEAPEFNGGEIQDGITTLAVTAEGTNFDSLTFTEDGGAITIDEFVYLNDVVFEDDVTIGHNLDLDTGFTGGVVEGDLSIGAFKARLVDVELQGDVGLAGGADLRLRELTFNPSKNVTIGDNGALLLRDITFADNGYTVNVDGISGMDLLFRGEIEGNDVTTFDNMASYTFENSPVINKTKQSDLNDVAEVATFNDNTFEDLATVNAEAVFNDNTFTTTDITAINEEARFEGNTFEVKVLSADTLNQDATFIDNTFEDDFATTSINSEATFERNTFEAAIGSIDAAASFEGNTFDVPVTAGSGGALGITFTKDVFNDDFTVEDPDAVLTAIEFDTSGTNNIDITIDEVDSVEVVGGLANSLTVTDTTSVTTDKYSFSDMEITAIGVNDVDFEATFTNNELNSVDTISADAILEGNTFDSSVTVSGAAEFENNTFEVGLTDVTAAASFNGDTFEQNITVNDSDANFTDLIFDLENNAVTVNVDEDTTLNGLAVDDAGAGNDFEVLVAANKKVNFEGEVEYSDLTGDFILNIVAASADYDNNATWNPDFSNVVIQD